MAFEISLEFERLPATCANKRFFREFRQAPTLRFVLQHLGFRREFSLAIGTWEAADVAMKSIFMQLHLSIVDKTQIAKIAWNRRVNFGDFVMIDFPQMLHQIRFEFEGGAAFFADEGLIVGMTSLVSLSLEHRLEFPTANIADKLKVFRLSLNGLLHLADLVYYA